MVRPEGRERGYLSSHQQQDGGKIAFADSKQTSEEIGGEREGGCQKNWISLYYRECHTFYRPANAGCFTKRVANGDQGVWPERK